MGNSTKGLPYVGQNQCVVNGLGVSQPIAHKREIVGYLRSNNLVGMCASWMTDKLTGRPVIGWRANVRCDDTYSWGESIAYYLDKYDAELPSDFLFHIYQKLGIAE